MTIFLISDTHFSHANILKFTWRPRSRRYCGLDEQQCDEACKAAHPEVRIRPEFTTVEEMNEAMVERWNATVRPPDHVYHLGDVAYKTRESLDIVKRLNGHKRVLLGNHDPHDMRVLRAVGFEKVFGTRKLDRWLLSHFPIHEAHFGKGVSGNIHGHIHQNPSPAGPYVNVCVEQIAYTPVALEAIKL